MIYERLHCHLRDFLFTELEDPVVENLEQKMVVEDEAGGCHFMWKYEPLNVCCINFTPSTFWAKVICV